MTGKRTGLQNYSTQCDPTYLLRSVIKIRITSKLKLRSRVAQWKRAGPITQRSVDRNHALLNIFFRGEDVSYRPLTKFAKVMYLQVCVCPQEGHACFPGGCVLPGGVCFPGACMLHRGACVLPRGCMLPGGVHASQGGMYGCGEGAWLQEGGVHGCRRSVHGCRGGVPGMHS